MNLKAIKDLDKDELLGMLGLATKQTTVSWVSGTLGIFGIGLLAGAGLGLMLAPKTGRELRGDVRHQLQRVPDGIGDAYQRLTGSESHGSESAAAKA